MAGPPCSLCLTPRGLADADGRLRDGLPHARRHAVASALDLRFGSVAQVPTVGVSLPRELGPGLCGGAAGVGPPGQCGPGLTILGSKHLRSSNP